LLTIVNSDAECAFSWFAKHHFTYFTTKLNKFIEPQFDYGKNVIPTTSHMKFLGVTIDCTLSWSKHIELLTSKLNSVCYLIRNVKPYMSVSILRTIYHSFFHSIMSLGTIFGGNSHHSIKIFKMQKICLVLLWDVGIGNRVEVYLSN
jgi:hypothetical protein